MTGEGKVKLGADVASLGKVLGSSLYTGKEAHIITKELLQKSFDSVRGVKDGQVTVDIDQFGNRGDKGTITISDNGKGMTADELGTIFTDLGSSGKRGDAEASGGFGLAKAAPLMMSERISVESVSDVNGKRIKSSFTATPEDLLGNGVKMEQQVVSPDTPTGTKVVSKLPSNVQGWYDAKNFLSNFQKSIKMPGKLNVVDAGNFRPEARDMKFMKTVTIPDSANIDIYVAKGSKGLENQRGSVTVEVNNNGIFQFNKSLYLGKDAVLKDAPSVISVDIRPTAKEGSPNYPFSANRESLRGNALSLVDEYIQDEIIRPSLARGEEFIAKKYNSLPTVKSDLTEFPIFDSGARMYSHEIAQISNNPAVIKLADAVAIAVDQSLNRIAQKSNIFPEGLKGLGEGIERTGFVFSDKLHGVHIKNKATGKATLFVNPFSYAAAATPTEAASMLWHTIKHEILHDKIGGHYQDFTTGEVKVSQALGDLELDSLLSLRGAYGEPTKGGQQFHKGLNEALQIYRESRGRAERERDPFGGEESRAGNTGSGGKPGDVRAVRSGGEEPIRPPASNVRTAAPPIAP